MFTHTHTLHWSLRQDHDRCSAECSKSEHGIHLCARVLTHSSFHLYTPKAFLFGRNKHRRSAGGFIRYGHIMGHLHVAAKFAACDENSSHRSPDPHALLCSGRSCGCNSAHNSATRRPFAALKTAAAPPSYAGSSAAFPSLLPFSAGKVRARFQISWVQFEIAPIGIKALH